MLSKGQKFLTYSPRPEPYEGEERVPQMPGVVSSALSMLVAASLMSSYSYKTGTQIHCTWSEGN